jgi:hypothetical protein
MQPWAEVQATFERALLDPAAPPPSGVLEAAGFSVYRNNVVSSLLNALQARFPVTHELVGDEFFRAMCRLFVREHLPASPVLLCYGDALPEFIASFAPAQGVPYLADVARLEAAWSRAYHAAEARALDAAALREIDPASLAASTLRLHPSAHLIRSPYPVVTLWSAHQSGMPSGMDLQLAEDALIVRPDADVLVHRLSPGAFAFLHSLQHGASIEQAAGAAVGEHPQFDAGAHLVGLFSIGAITAIALPEEESI